MLAYAVGLEHSKVDLAVLELCLPIANTACMYTSVHVLRLVVVPVSMVLSRSVCIHMNFPEFDA